MTPIDPLHKQALADAVGMDAYSLELGLGDVRSLVISQMANRHAKGLFEQIAVGWFLPEDYEEAKQFCPDAARDADYEQWVTYAESIIRELTQKMPTTEIIRVVIRPEKFRAWCEQHNLQPDSASRAVFAMAQYDSNEA